VKILVVLILQTHISQPLAQTLQETRELHTQNVGTVQEIVADNPSKAEGHL
jgi:hypothetical protein